MTETATNNRIAEMPMTISPSKCAEDKPLIKYAAKDGIRKQYVDSLAQLESLITQARIDWLVNRGSDTETQLKANLDRMTAKFDVVEADLIALDA